MGRPELPGWLTAWCSDELGAAPVESLLAAGAVSTAVAVRLDDGRAVVVKARPAEGARTQTCVEIQRTLADGGFPCARPLTAVSFASGLAVHAEEWLPGGEMTRGDDAAHAARSATLFADLAARLGGLDAAPPLPNPEWVRWDHDGPGLFPPNPRHDARAREVPLPDDLAEIGRRVRGRLNREPLPRVLGHADWEAQNLRWTGGEPHAVHDWDSLAWLPEAALAGAASGAFASTEVPTLASLDGSTAFLQAYERARGRPFDRNEREVAWAASLWPALHNARVEVFYGEPPLASNAVREQAEMRLALAGA